MWTWLHDGLGSVLEGLREHRFMQGFRGKTEVAGWWGCKRSEGEEGI